MKVSDLMTRDVFTVNIDETCEAAARILYERDVGSVPVIDPTGGGLVGIVTDRDICMCAYTQHKRLDEIVVGEAMSDDVICADENDAIENIEDLMQSNQIRRIPVIDAAGLVIGIVSVADLAKARGRYISNEALAKTVDAVSQPPA